MFNRRPGPVMAPMQPHTRNDLSAIPRQQPGIPGYPGYPRPGTRAAHPLEPLGLNGNSLTSFLTLFSAIPDQLGHLLSVYMTRCNTLIAHYCHQYPVAAPYLSRFALAAALPLALYALYSGVTLVFSSAVALFAVLGVQVVAMLFGLMILLLGLGSIAGAFFVMFLAEYYQVVNRTRSLGLAVMDVIVGSAEDDDRASARGRSLAVGGAPSLTLHPPAQHHRHSAMLLHPAADASGAAFAGPLHSVDVHSTLSARSVPLASAHHYVPEHHMPSPTQEYYDDGDGDDDVHHSTMLHSSSSIVNGQYSAEYPVPTPSASPARQSRSARKPRRTAKPSSSSAAIRPTSSISSRSLDPEDLPSDDSDADAPLADFVEQSNADADDWDEQIYGGGGLKMRANKNTKRSSVLSALSVLLSAPVPEEQHQEEEEAEAEATARDEQERQRVRYDEVDTDQTDAMAKLMGGARAGSAQSSAASKKRSSDWRRSLAEMDRELVEDLRRIGQAEERQQTHVIVEEAEAEDHDQVLEEEEEEGELIEVEVEEEIEVEVEEDDQEGGALDAEDGEASLSTAAAVALPPTPPLSESKLAVSA